MEQARMQVRVIRSPRRRKTVSASLSGGVLVVRVPEGLSSREEQEWVRRMKERVLGQAARRHLGAGSDLARRAEELNRRHFGGRLEFSIRWVTNQKQRWGSCTPASKAIRISHELARMPRYVLDYVIVHELAHLVHADHSNAFWELVHRYPQAEKAIGFLTGYSFARGDAESPCGLPSLHPVPVSPGAPPPH